MDKLQTRSTGASAFVCVIRGHFSIFGSGQGPDWVSSLTSLAAATIWLFSAAQVSAAGPAESVPESPDQAQARHERVARRRGGLAVICHRGASEFAHENTLEAYRAAFELGADG